MKIIITFLVITTSFFSAFTQEKLFYSAQVEDSTGTFSYIIFDSTGKQLIDGSHDWIGVNYWDWILVSDDKKSIAYNSEGEPLGIYNIESTHHVWVQCTLIPLKKEGLWGFYNKTGELIIAHQFKDATLFHEDKAAVILDQDTLLIDRLGVQIDEPFIEDQSRRFERLSGAYGLTSWANADQETFTKKGKVGLREVKTGKVIIKPIYDGLFNLEKGQVTVELNGLFGVVNFNNEVVIPIKYKKVMVLD